MSPSGIDAEEVKDRKGDEKPGIRVSLESPDLSHEGKVLLQVVQELINKSSTETSRSVLKGAKPHER